MTRDFTVTGVLVAGPLRGLQGRTYGHGVRPARRFTRAQSRELATHWHCAPIGMAWEHQWVVHPTDRGLRIGRPRPRVVVASDLARVAAEPVPAGCAAPPR